MPVPYRKSTAAHNDRHRQTYSCPNCHETIAVTHSQLVCVSCGHVARRGAD